jgi:hypothetical protein
VGGVGGLLALGVIVLGFLVLVCFWCLLASLNDPMCATQQSEKKGGDRMVRIVDIGFVSLIANGGTALYVNSLPTLSIRA